MEKVFFINPCQQPSRTLAFLEWLRCTVNRHFSNMTVIALWMVPYPCDPVRSRRKSRWETWRAVQTVAASGCWIKYRNTVPPYCDHHIRPNPPPRSRLLNQMKYWLTAIHKCMCRKVRVRWVGSPWGWSLRMIPRTLRPREHQKPRYGRCSPMLRYATSKKSLIQQTFLVLLQCTVQYCILVLDGSRIRQGAEDFGMRQGAVNRPDLSLISGTRLGRRCHLLRSMMCSGIRGSGHNNMGVAAPQGDEIFRDRDGIPFPFACVLNQRRWWRVSNLTALKTRLTMVRVHLFLYHRVS